MKEKMCEALKTTVKVYLVLILIVLPLYMQDGYVMIGDVKYFFFRNVTLFFMVVTTAMLTVQMAVRKKGRGKPLLSCTDIITLLYGGSALLSWCFSAYKGTAWRGAVGFYMGLLSQLMFIWIFFAVSRWCGDTRDILWAFFTGAVIVMALGGLNRYCFDPLSLFEGLEDWNRTHLLSTIGNQNWYCGYLSVASAVCISFACVGSKAQRGAGLAGSLLFFWTLLTQGSEGGYLILFAEMTVAFFWSLGGRTKFLAFLSLLACCPLAALLGQYCIRFRGLMLVEDGLLSGFLFWKGWLYALVFLATLLILLWIREKKECVDKLGSGGIQKAALCFFGVSFALGIAVFIACQIWEGVWVFWGQNELLRITDSWGNSRGALWRMGIGSFMQGSFWDKWIGVGPDCFGNVIYALYPVDDIIHATGQWAAAAYVNAHNEWLNVLVNQGILGMVFYGGIFVTLFWRLRKCKGGDLSVLLGLLAIAGYCAYGLVSFQQAVSTPLMFGMLGISEGVLRRTGVPVQASH